MDDAINVTVSINTEFSISQSTKLPKSKRKKRGHATNDGNIDTTTKYVLDMCTQLDKILHSPHIPPQKVSAFYMEITSKRCVSIN